MIPVAVIDKWIVYCPPHRNTDHLIRMPSTTPLSAGERLFLLQQRGISHGVVARIEAIGIGSLQDLIDIGSDELCRRLQEAHGRNLWSNRRRALQAAIDAAAAIVARRRAQGDAPDRPATYRTDLYNRELENA